MKFNLFSCRRRSARHPGDSRRPRAPQGRAALPRREGVSGKGPEAGSSRSSSRSRWKPKAGGGAIPSCAPGDSLVFVIPDGLVRISDRDLKLAGIAKRDDRDRTLDIHALRTTFGTLLSKGGVPLRTAQAAIRHSDPSLTANVYTDPRLLEVSGALEALPSLPLGTGPDSRPERVRAVATGTHDRSLVRCTACCTDQRPTPTNGGHRWSRQR